MSNNPLGSQSGVAAAQIKDRAFGAVLGLAVGDALGTTLEFTPRDSRPHHTEMIGGGVFRLPAGCWTDDTQMALALAESIVANGGVNEADLMARFSRWLRKGEYSPTGYCFDCGIATREAIERFERTKNPISGSDNPLSAGNGCLMRLSPVSIWHRESENEAAVAARRQASTTHRAAICLDASDYFARLLVRAMNGMQKAELLLPVTSLFSGKVGEIAAGSWRSKSRSQIKSTGFVIDSLYPA